MIGTVVRVLRHPLNQDVALTNAQQAAMRLAHRRRQREEVDAYLAQLRKSRPDDCSSGEPPVGGEETKL